MSPIFEEDQMMRFASLRTDASRAPVLFCSFSVLCSQFSVLSFSEYFGRVWAFPHNDRVICKVWGLQCCNGGCFKMSSSKNSGIFLAPKEVPESEWSDVGRTNAPVFILQVTIRSRRLQLCFRDEYVRACSSERIFCMSCAGQ